MENQRYMQEGLDGKRILLLLRKKLWIVMVAGIGGALIGGGVYLFIHLVFASEREFQTVSKLYLNFNCEPEDFSELSYNGYTWNDLMATDPILDYTMEGLPVEMDRGVVIGATKAEILSDIRLLTITITVNEPELAARIMEATQKSLVHLGETDDLFDSIEVYSTVEPQQIVWDNRTVNAAVTGAVIGLFVVFMMLAFYYVLDDSVYVAGDVEKRYGIPVFGVFTAGGEDKEQPYGREFAVNYSYLCRNVGKASLVCVDAGEETEAAVGRMIGKVVGVGDIWDGKGGEETSGEKVVGVGEGRSREKVIKIPKLQIGGRLEGDMGGYRRIRETDGVILAVRFGGRNGKRLERALGNLKKQDCKVLGAVIIDADEKFLKLYYLGKQVKA